MTMVAPWEASFSISSFSGTGVLPAMRVNITVWLTFGRVYSALSAAAAPMKELTPAQSILHALSVENIHLLPNGPVDARVAGMQADNFLSSVFLHYIDDLFQSHLSAVIDPASFLWQ